MSLVLLADAQARSGASVTQAMIDEEEAWLESRIGPLSGELSETFTLPANLHGTIDAVYLSRRTDVLTSFTSNGTPLITSTDWRLLNGYVVEKVSDSTAAWDDPLIAIYTPNDLVIVKGIIYDLLTYRTLPSNLQSVRIGAYSETYATGSGGSTAAVKVALLGKVLTSAGLGAYAHPFRIKTYRRDRTLLEATGS